MRCSGAADACALSGWESASLRALLCVCLRLFFSVFLCFLRRIVFVFVFVFVCMMCVCACVYLVSARALCMMCFCLGLFVCVSVCLYLRVYMCVFVQFRAEVEGRYSHEEIFSVQCELCLCLRSAVVPSLSRSGPCVRRKLSRVPPPDHRTEGFQCRITCDAGKAQKSLAAKGSRHYRSALRNREMQ